MVKVPFAVANGVVGFPQTADRNRGWLCPGCDKPVVLHRGEVRIPHFAHKGHNSGCGESLTHRSTKEWIAQNVSSPDFAITSTCGTCRTDNVVFSGHPSFGGHTEVPHPHWRSPAYRIDAVAAEQTRVRAAIEVCHAHKAGPVKMSALAAATYNQAFEIKAVDLIESNYPMSFATIAERTCDGCLKQRRLQRKANAKQKLANRVSHVIQSWKHRATARDKARALHIKRFAQRWRRRPIVARLLAADTAARATLAHTLTPCIIQAPAGGGKTTLIIRMAAGTKERCDLLTFSKDLATSIDATPHLRVRTFDSACCSLTKSGGPLSDKAIIEDAYPNCKPWYKKKGRRHIGNIATLRLQGVHVKLCESHAAVAHGIQKATRLPSWPASRRTVEDSKQDVAAGCKWLFIDEHQDLNQQAINIVCNSSAPTVWVGDPHQAIYQFQTALHCDECVATSKAPVLPTLPRVELSRTFRLPQSIVDYLWDAGHRLVTTNQRGGFLRVPATAFVSTLTSHTCVLARHNAAIYDAAKLAADNIPVVVVGGSKIAAEIRSAVKAKNFEAEPGGFKVWIGNLSTPNMVADWLDAHDGDHNSSACRFSTVHRAKGTQAKHVVLVGEWDWEEEANVCYVAHTRHTSSLIICEPPKLY